jgi:G3E family GTPase
MIPVNIITGVLGVGKTTAIRHLLSQRPPNEKWAVVVNEFGALGIDGALLDTAAGIADADVAGTSTTGGGDGGVVVREVAGGCLCCAVAAPFTVAVTQVLRRAKPDRLLIEPSGMGHPGGLFDALSGEFLRGALELRATIALVDVAVVSSY